MSEDQPEIDVRFEPAHENPTIVGDRPMLTWGAHPFHGNGWTLWYVEEDGNGVEEHFIPGDVTDVDEAVRSARSWLRLLASGSE